jgi:hypothetical protein
VNAPSVLLLEAFSLVAVNTFSALVALATSAFKSAEPVDDDAST